MLNVMKFNLFYQLLFLGTTKTLKKKKSLE